jgi:hypothetical protein
MKIQLRATFTSLILAAAFVLPAAAAVPSKLSGYAGKSNGTISFGGLATGPAQGTIKASSKKEKGTIRLSSAFSAGLQSVQLTEFFALQKRSYTYQFIANGSISSVGGGSGVASIGKNTITLSGTANIAGSNYSMATTIRKTAKRLFVTNVLSGSGGAVISYSLKRKIRR